MSIPPRTVALIGAGPVGLDLAYQLRKKQISYYHFDQGPIGNTLLDLPAEATIGSAPDIQIADCPLSASGTYDRDAYLAYLRSVVRKRQLEVQTFEHVCGIHRLGTQWHLRTAGHNQVCHQYRARYLVFATGNRNLRRTSLFPGAESPLVHAELRHPQHYFQRTVLIVGSGPGAQAAALRCAGIARQVYLCSADTELRPTPMQPDLRSTVIRLVQQHRITYLPGRQVQKLNGSQVVLCDRNSSTLDLEVDFLLAQQGDEPDYSLLHKTGVSLKGPAMAPVHDPETMETNVPGLYVAGAIALGTACDHRAIPFGRKHARRIAAAIPERLEEPLLPPSAQRWLPIAPDWSWW